MGVFGLGAYIIFFLSTSLLLAKAFALGEFAEYHFDHYWEMHSEHGDRITCILNTYNYIKNISNIRSISQISSQ